MHITNDWVHWVQWIVIAIIVWAATLAIIYSLRRVDEADMTERMANDAYDAVFAANGDHVCLSCPERMPFGECPNSQRPCGHHCNCSWIHDHCHWCGKEFGEEAV